MAEEEKQEEGENTVEKKSNKKLFIIIGAVVALIFLIGAPVLFFTLGGKKDGLHEADSKSAGGESGMVIEGYDDEDEFDEDEQPMGALFPMKTFVVNLSGAEKFLRVQIQVEFEKRSVPRRFYTKLVVCRDALIQLLTARTPGELASHKGKEELKEDIKDSINVTLKREEVETVYFTQFIIQ